ncbi:hypothetical protein [Pseudomonas donghuensis]|uniref:hypothetical protein n=1 Tax=Pseudomonas donghuensis TaxID=1163398 RepID=UPI002E1315AE|nr:hypothetical protein VP780_15300 [Pseudomonas donghuensis]
MKGNIEVVCDGCVGDVFLRQRIRDQCDMAKCSVCEHVRPCIAIEVLADDIAEILYNFYGTDPVIRTCGAGDLGRYIRAGNPLALIVAEMLECDDSEGSVTAAIVELLIDCSDYDLKRGGESDSSWGFDPKLFEFFKAEAELDEGKRLSDAAYRGFW